MVSALGGLKDVDGPDALAWHQSYVLVVRGVYHPISKIRRVVLIVPCFCTANTQNQRDNDD